MGKVTKLHVVGTSVCLCVVKKGNIGSCSATNLNVVRTKMLLKCFYIEVNSCFIAAVVLAGLALQRRTGIVVMASLPTN